MKEGKKYLELNDLSAYTKAFELSNKVWEIIIKWGYFPKSTVGMQLVRAVDSVSANIAEGFGRYSKKDKIRFYIIARGSVTECIDWINKARERCLLKNEEYYFIQQDLYELPREINGLIKYTNDKLKI